jgi:glycosyltransferase involved in cell wall biosynthesis
MKIGIEAQRLFRTKKHGMDIVALELIKSLQQVDTENEYHIFVKKDVDSGCIQFTNPNFILHELPSLPYPIWEQIFLSFYIRKLKLDLLHCTANTAPIFCPCKKVVTLHDIIFLEANPIGGNGTLYQQFGNLYRKYVVPFVVKTSELLMTVSYFEQKRIIDYFGLNEEKVKVVYNGVGPHFFHQHNEQEKVALKKEYGLPENYILFLGNKNPKKNLPNVIKACERYMQKNEQAWNLVVLDFPKENLLEFIESEGLSKGLLDKVVSIGYVNNQKLPLLIQASQLFLYPSLRESFGIPILEAMACGVPVITSNTSSMPEVSADCAILVNPESIDEISEAIFKIQNDYELRERLVKDGLNRSLSFSWDSSAKTSLEIYKNVVGA